jgi:ubiquitin-like protein Pup
MNNKGDAGSNDDAEAEEVRARHERLSEAVDAILDEIDEVEEENANEFVRSYVQKGGQGWSGFITPEFYVGAAAAGVLSGATYDMFKEVLRRISKALRQVPGRSTGTSKDYEVEDISAYEATVINEAWQIASRLAEQQDIQHSIDQATALHWAVFTMELEHSLGSIHLGTERYERLVRASAASDEEMDESELAARIIDQWLERRGPYARLRKTREKAGFTLEDAARQLEWSLSKLSPY